MIIIKRKNEQINPNTRQMEIFPIDSLINEIYY